MKIGYMPDTHSGAYDQPIPSRETVAAFAEQLLEEGEQAERSGFDGVFFPERHARSECVFPPPLIIMERAGRAHPAGRSRHDGVAAAVVQSDAPGGGRGDGR